MSQINVLQINQAQLTAFVTGAVAGGNFSGFLNAYTAAAGYMGATLMYVSGGNQLVLGIKTFDSSPQVPYSGAGTGSAASQKFVQDTVIYYVNALSGTMTGGFIPLNGDAVVGGYKFYTGAVSVGTPSLLTHAATLAYVNQVSGVLQSGLNSVIVPNVVTTNTAQDITAVKTFTLSPKVPLPSATGDAVNLAYVNSLPYSGTVHVTGNEVISGVKTFVQSPLVPLATLPSQAVPKQQLDALGVSIGGVNGFAGVLSLNGSTGAASGAVYIIGGGTVSVWQCGAVFTISGNTANNTQYYSASVPLLSGVTGLTVVFPSGSGQAFSTAPAIADSLEVTGGTGGFIGRFIYGKSLSGFSVAFIGGIPDGNFVYNFHAVPPASGASGFVGLIGPTAAPGASLNSRGVWQAGLLYSNLDWVYQPTVYASYACTQTHTSTNFNAPSSTGGANWAILSSGVTGPSGLWAFYGLYNTGSTYIYGNSVTQSGSTFGYTGNLPVSNVDPIYQTGGWTVLAQQSPVGYFVNSGIITGNFVNISFFLEPVITGFELAEAIVAKNFQYTGYGLSCVTSGVQPDIAGILTGRIYTRTLATNTKTILSTFTFNTGLYYYISGGFGIPFTGNNVIGVDLTSTLSGITKLSVGVFGFGLN